MSITKDEYQSAYETGFPKTIRFLRLRGLPEAEAEDVAQAAGLRGWTKRDALREPARVGGWINVIALNIMRYRLRRDRKLEPLPMHAIQGRPDSCATRIDVRRALLRCSPADRVLLEDLCVRGYNSEEAGRRWALTPAAVRTRACRAKQRLREWLRPRGTPKTGQ